MPCVENFIPVKMPQDQFAAGGQTKPPSPYGNYNNISVTALTNYLITVIDAAGHGDGIDPLPMPKKLFLPLLFAKADGSLPVADFPGGAGADLTYYNRYIAPVMAKYNLTAQELLLFKNLWLATIGTIIVDVTAANRLAPAITLALANETKFFNGLNNGSGWQASRFLYSPDGQYFNIMPSGYGYLPGGGAYSGSFYLMEII